MLCVDNGGLVATNYCLGVCFLKNILWVSCFFFCCCCCCCCCCISGLETHWLLYNGSNAQLIFEAHLCEMLRNSIEAIFSRWRIWLKCFHLRLLFWLGASVEGPSSASLLSHGISSASHVFIFFFLSFFFFILQGRCSATTISHGCGRPARALTRWRRMTMKTMKRMTKIWGFWWGTLRLLSVNNLVYLQGGGE